MKKYIFYTIFIFLGATFLGSFVNAEDDAIPERVNEPIKELRDLREQNKRDFKSGADEFKNDIRQKRDEARENLALDKDSYKLKLDAVREEIKLKREEFKNEMKIKREEAKVLLDSKKEEFKLNLEKIKDLKKKESVEKIANRIEALNTKVTTLLGEKVSQIEKVLISVESRIAKAKARGLDVSAAEAKVLIAKDAIAKARGDIATQAGLNYVPELDENTLKADMKVLREKLRGDLKLVKESVKKAHFAVRDTATTLAQIPKVNDDTEEVEEVEKETENETSNNNEATETSETTNEGNTTTE